MGADITPPGMPATDTGIESVSFLATMAAMKKESTTGSGMPATTSASVTGASTAVSSVPGATPMAV